MGSSPTEATITNPNTKDTMSRSFKKVFGGKPGKGMSDKADKQSANRKFRRLIRNLLHIGEEHFPRKREVTDTWDFTSDGGSRYWSEIGNATEEEKKYIFKKYMRK